MLYRERLLRLLAGKRASYTSDIIKSYIPLAGFVAFFVFTTHDQICYNVNMKKIILLGIILIFSTSCTAIGSAVMSAIGGLDFIVHTATDKGLVDHAVSEIRGEDCKISNIVKENREICKELEKKKLEQKMLDLQCEVYSWDINGKVYCKKDYVPYKHSLER